MFGVSNSMVKECRTLMDLSRLIVYAQQIEEEKLGRERQGEQEG